MSPSDRTSRNVLEWLERLTSSLPSNPPPLPPPGNTPHLIASTSPNLNNGSSMPLGTGALAHRSPTTGIDEESGDELSHQPQQQQQQQRQRQGHTSIVGGQDSPDDKDDEDEELGGKGGSELLPDSRHPLGLIANLSLNSPEDTHAHHGNAHSPRHGAGGVQRALSTGGGDGNGTGQGQANQGQQESQSHSQPNQQQSSPDDSASGLNNTNTKVKEEQFEEDEDDVGVASASFFRPGPATDLGVRASLIERHSPPEILVHGLVTPDEVDELFEM